MLASFRKSLRATFLSISVSVLALGLSAHAQSGNSTSVTGTVLDPSGAVVPNAKVEITNPVSQFQRTTNTDALGKFSIPNVPFNPYHMTVAAKGFSQYTKDIDVRSSVPLNLSVNMAVGASAETVTVEASGADLLENDPTFHTDVDRDLFDKIPLESQSSSLSSLITLASPGVAADSNGLFHGVGDHAENSFSVDGQPITDQQSKVFSNQIPLDAIQSTEVISGAPPAEYGEKASLVINVTTRSGQGMTTPHGSVTASYGSFGTSSGGVNFGYGGQKWGNFISINGLNSGRFLDPPEFTVIHAHGNEQNAFDRLDFQLTKADSVHVNLGFTRSWFQTPNSFDQQNAAAWNGLVVDNGGLGPDGLPVGAADQRSQIKTFNIAPSWTRLINNNTVFTLGAFVRRDQFNYYPSGNPFADLAPGLQQETFSQDRTLTNAGIRSDLSYVKGLHNLKAGVTYQQTFLDEKNRFGIVDPTLNPVCFNGDGSPDTDPTVTDPAQCGGVQNPGGSANPDFNSLLLPADLTRGGSLFPFNGHTDVKLLSLYLQDAISKGNWSINLGVRGDIYNGLTSHKEAEPRIGIAYNVKKTNTVLRVSYARILETPFNENLVLSSTGCADLVLNPLLVCSSNSATPFSPGWRNEFHAGLQQALGRYLVFSGEYIWKYTHNAYDFGVFGATPLTFPIEWHNSKIPAVAGRVSVPEIHGFSALFVFSSVAARFFNPQLGGAGAVPPGTGGTGNTPFRIDHDESFNQTTHLQYQPWKTGPWFGFNWRYDSGLVAGAVPFATSADPNDPGFIVDLTGLTADQQLQAGLSCGGVSPTLSAPLTTCAGNLYASTRVTIPAPGTENDDHNPPRIAPRHLFDVTVGDDNLFRGDKYKWSLQLTAVNVTNKQALYNYLSTFTGTHYVTPRTLTAQLAFHF
ncbi:MAG TPA: TonB-dependent receptor [Candidatus Binatia bacterium]|nr:TonB-dependent receptor [Candidatus Binatia bacterium]